MPPGITQPIIAMAYCPQGQAAGTFSPYSVGMQAFFGAGNIWTFSFDVSQPINQIVISATPKVTGAPTQVSAVVDLGTEFPVGKMYQFTAAAMLAGVATAAAGLMVMVSLLPSNK